jgi:hypothetical protein
MMVMLKLVLMMMVKVMVLLRWMLLMKVLLIVLMRRMLLRKVLLSDWGGFGCKCGRIISL